MVVWYRMTVVGGDVYVGQVKACLCLWTVCLGGRGGVKTTREETGALALFLDFYQG